MKKPSLFEREALEQMTVTALANIVLQQQEAIQYLFEEIERLKLMINKVHHEKTANCKLKTIAQYLLILISTVSLVVSTPSQNGFANATPAEDLQAKISEFDRAIRLNPKNALAYYQRGRLRYQQIDLSAAFADYNRALRLNPNLADAYHARGLLKVEYLEKYDSARTDYDLAIKLNPNHSLAFHDRGALYEKLGNWNSALVDYNRAIALDPHYRDAYSDRGRLKANNLKDPKGALADYSQAIVLDPQFALSYYHRGALKHSDEIGDLPGAVSDYDRAILLWSSGASPTHPKFADTYYNRGLIKANELKDAAGAIQDFRQALQFYREQGRGDDMMSAENQLRYLGITID
jgi:tetratricopeptide (TPR) repeat protein